MNVLESPSLETLDSVCQIWSLVPFLTEPFSVLAGQHPQSTRGEGLRWAPISVSGAGGCACAEPHTPSSVPSRVCCREEAAPLCPGRTREPEEQNKVQAELIKMVVAPDCPASLWGT